MVGEVGGNEVGSDVNNTDAPMSKVPLCNEWVCPW